MPENEQEEVTGTQAAAHVPQSPTKQGFDFGSIGDFLKTWIPIAVMVVSGIIGYVVFKAETKHQFDILTREITALQRSVDDASDLNNKIRGVERVNDKQNIYLKFLIQDARDRGVNIPNIGGLDDNN